MDIKEYIESGIISGYVLDSVSKQERQEVECMSKIYPEIAEELTRQRSVIETMALKNSVTPPVFIKSNILSKIKETPQDLKEENFVQAAPKKETKIVPINRALRVLSAASVVLFIVMGSLYIIQRGETNSVEQQYAEIQEKYNTEKDNFNASLKALQASADKAVQRDNIISSPYTQELRMNGTDKQPTAEAKIYWDKSSKELFLSSAGLPAAANGKQYQLWAIADGVPVDLGVLNKDALFTDAISVDLDKIQAFAITLEKEGGSVAPTLEEMYVIVSV